MVCLWHAKTSTQNCCLHVVSVGDECMHVSEDGWVGRVPPPQHVLAATRNTRMKRRSGYKGSEKSGRCRPQSRAEHAAHELAASRVPCINLQTHTFPSTPHLSIAGLLGTHCHPLPSTTTRDHNYIPSFLQQVASESSLPGVNELKMCIEQIDTSL